MLAGPARPWATPSLLTFSSKLSFLKEVHGELPEEDYNPSKRGANRNPQAFDLPVSGRSSPPALAGSLATLASWLPADDLCTDTQQAGEPQ